MVIPKFGTITTLSNAEVSEEISKSEKKLFTLRFKKSTRQPFKSHEIKQTKRQLAQLKTLLKLRLNSKEKKIK